MGRHSTSVPLSTPSMTFEGRDLGGRTYLRDRCSTPHSPHRLPFHRLHHRLRHHHPVAALLPGPRRPRQSSRIEPTWRHSRRPRKSAQCSDLYPVISMGEQEREGDVPSFETVLCTAVRSHLQRLLGSSSPSLLRGACRGRARGC